MPMERHLTFYQNSFNLPHELKFKPLSLIGFSGLDIVNNAVHKSIWETFNNRTEKAPILYKIISNTHTFPVIKPKRNSYDWYLPKGILKRNWLNKHLQEVPALIVIFFDLDWKDSLWNEKVIECASKVLSMKTALQGRDCRILVVLIQNQMPVPEDPLASERAVALCSSCELNAQSLYVLPHGQHLLGYTIRLEKAFFEFSHNYYSSCVKNVKMHKEYLDKSSHQNLFVRHEFKMGFLNELKQDMHSAYKHYTWAYKNLLDIQMTAVNSLELCTVAGFINYKICKLQFALNLPRDAISQFKIHIEKFKNNFGFPQLAFEHYAWLSKQFEIFADIFDEAVKLGLPAVQTQHPGVYYQQSAQYALIRKKMCQELCSKVIAYPHPDPLENIDRMEFYGQRPWRPGKIEPSESAIEDDGIQALQYLENQVSHSSLIISLYGLAIAQYKIYKCPRTRRYLVLEMADECYHSKDFGKALTLYTHMLSDYREEKWHGIISNILEKAIICAYLTASVQDYLQLSFEVLSMYTIVSIEDKRRIYENLNRIFKKQIPYGSPKLSHDILQNAIILWQPVFGRDSLIFDLDFTNIVNCLETKVKFCNSTVQIDQSVCLEVFIRSTCPFPLTINDIAVKITTQHINTEFRVNPDQNTFTLHLNEVQKFNIEFEPDCRDINSEIEIDHVIISIGNSSECLATLKFNGQGIQKALPELQYFKKSQESIDFDGIKAIPKATLVPRNSKLDVQIEHAPPALIGECYEMYISMVNKESCIITDLKIEVSKDENSEVELSSTPETSIEKSPLILQSPKTMDPDAKIVTSCFVRAMKPEVKNIYVKITYRLDSDKPLISIKNERIILPVMQPFMVDTQFLSGTMQHIQKFYAGEKFLMNTIIRFLSPFTIYIDDTSIEFIPPIKGAEMYTKSNLTGYSFIQEEIGSEVFVALSENQSDQNLAIANYIITWKRENGILTKTNITLNGHHCDWIPLNIEVLTPAYGIVRTPTVIKYHLINHSSHLVQLDVEMEASESFMFSGYRKNTTSVLPFSTKLLQYNLYPLLPGNVSLPKLILTIPENSTEGPALRQDQLTQLIDRTVPYSIYVMPQIKGDIKQSSVILKTNESRS
ncbi:hypothetical protein ABEB36_013385 [Hypothenemus hampei]|uniref:Trafficking protein particle complex subunit 11 n=1 Tax=Hypothenemus hampei TaxID=57062 RepID=A0ABD1E7U9_HYPHA